MERPMAQGAYFKLGSRSRTIHETSIALDKEKEKLIQRPRNIPTLPFSGVTFLQPSLESLRSHSPEVTAAPY